MTAAEWASRTQGRCRRLGRGQLETQPRLPPPARLKPGGPSPETEISRTLSWPRPGRSAPDRGRAGPGGLLPPPVGARLGWAGEGTCSQCPGRGDQAQIPLPSLPAQMAARSGSGRGGADRGARGVGFLLSHGPLRTWAQTALGARTGAGSHTARPPGLCPAVASTRGHPCRPPRQHPFTGHTCPRGPGPGLAVAALGSPF